MSLGLYNEGLRDPGTALSVRYADGRREPLRLDRWRGAVTAADESMLCRAPGPVLDVGCGPGRLVVALAARGVEALGVDVAAEAVALTRRSGGQALRLSVFDPLPDTGSWRTVLLADGNIGIGGDPVRLLRRVGALLAPGGRVLVELAAPGRGPAGSVRARLEGPGRRPGSWFRWAVLGVPAVGPVAGSAGLQLQEVWSAPEAAELRYFAALRRPPATP